MKSVAREGERLGPCGRSGSAGSGPVGSAVAAASLIVSLMFRTLGQCPDSPRPMTRLAGTSPIAAAAMRSKRLLPRSIEA